MGLLPLILQSFDKETSSWNSYDSWELDTQDITSYSGHLHIAALQAARKLAVGKGLSGLAAQCNYYSAEPVSVSCHSPGSDSIQDKRVIMDGPGTRGIENATAALQTKLWRATGNGSG